MTVNKTNKAANLFLRIVISAVGVALIIIAVSELMLYFYGETAIAAVRVRRVGGEDSGRTPDQRYEWSLDYSFMDKNGEIVNGTTTRRGSDISVKLDDRVYYFPFATYINALQSEAEPNFSQPLLVVIGVFLIYVMNRRKKKTRDKPSV
ncbi:MAG: hypothetical protein EOM87_08355 [Clostridia bacterium]|nr:hypothetical protein [Clostridia bacterium]